MFPGDGGLQVTVSSKRRDHRGQPLTTLKRFQHPHVQVSQETSRQALRHQWPQIEETRRQNDIKRRRGVAKLERIRVAADVEDVRVNRDWTAIATVKMKKYADMEKKHRGWIFREL